MSALGDQLRAAREKKGLSLAQAALETHIRGVIIQALEAGEYNQLPPPPFTRGLLKNYALFLKLDPELVLEDYAVEVGLKAPPPPPPEPPALQITPLPPKQRTFPTAENPPLFTPPPPPQRRPVVPPPPPPEKLEPTPQFGPTLNSTEPPPLRLNLSETVFQVAPEVPEERTPAPDPANFVQRLSATRLPEIVAGVALLIAFLAIGLFAYTRLFPAPASTPEPVVAAIVRTPSPTASRAATRPPSPVPTIKGNGGNGGTDTAVALTVPQTGKTAIPLPTLNVPAGAEMTLQITADQPIVARIVIDNVEVFNGTVQQGETKSWSAHQRLYFRVQDLPNGSVIFNSTRILARVFAERKVIERAWQMNAAGVAQLADAATFLTPPAPTATPSLTPTITPTFTATPTKTPTSSPTATMTATPSPTLTATSTVTNTPSPTPTQTTVPVPTQTPTPGSECVPQPNKPC